MKLQEIPLLRQLWQVILALRFILLSIIAIALGVVILMIAAPISLGSDIGIALLTAGTIGLALEFFTRRQFDELIAATVDSALTRAPLNSKIDTLHNLVSLEHAGLRDLISLGNDLRSLGIRQVYKNRLALDFLKLLAAAEPKEDIKILGTALMAFTNYPIQETMKSKIEAGSRIYLLALDPDSGFVEQRAKEENRPLEGIKTDIVSTNRIIHGFINDMDVSPELKRNILFHTYDAPPAFFIFSNGSIMIVGFYLREIRGEFSPHLELEIKQGGIHEAFLRHFDSLWLATEEHASQERHGDEGRRLQAND